MTGQRWCDEGDGSKAVSSWEKEGAARRQVALIDDMVGGARQGQESKYAMLKASVHDIEQVMGMPRLASPACHPRVVSR
jgi:hypothetical protein